MDRRRDDGCSTRRRPSSPRTESPARGVVDPTLDPADVYALVTAVSMTWSPASVLVAASRSDARADHDHRRALLAEAVRRMVAPP